MDLRYPIGGLFVTLGLILTGYGVMTANDTAMYARATGVNVNLWWGIVMFVTGVLFLLLAIRGGRTAAMRPAEETPMGRDTEARERARGLEH